MHLYCAMKLNSQGKNSKIWNQSYYSIYWIFVKFDLKSKHSYLFCFLQERFTKLEIMSVSVISKDKDELDWKKSLV